MAMKQQRNVAFHMRDTENITHGKLRGQGEGLKLTWTHLDGTRFDVGIFLHLFLISLMDGML